jgi:uncharacterized protein (DUF433 family)
VESGLRLRHRVASIPAACEVARRTFCSVGGHGSVRATKQRWPAATLHDTLSHMDRIEVDPDVCNGRPVIRGTCIAAKTILEFLGAGDSLDDVSAAYPILTRDEVLAALQYASKLLANQQTVLQVA